MDARGERIVRGSVLLTAMVAGVGIYAWSEGAEGRALHRIGVAERAAIYVKTWDSFKELCAPPVSSALEERCKGQAHFLSLFPECIDTCRETVARTSATSTR